MRSIIATDVPVAARTWRRPRRAQAIVEGVHAPGLEVRAGLHTGECELLDGKVAGIAVHTGARVASQAARRGARLQHRQGPRRRLRLIQEAADSGGTGLLDHAQTGRRASQRVTPEARVGEQPLVLGDGALAPAPAG